MRILWLIVARSGSRSIPDKNVARLGGHPLLAWRIAAALRLSPGEHVWLSTDSQDYAKIGQAYGATIPFIRPAELAADGTPSADVVLHAMRHAIEHERRYDFVALLEPTSPFVLPTTLESASAALAADAQAHAVVATRRVRPSTLYIQPEARYLEELSARIGSGPPARRQDEPAEITPSGGFYIARWEAFLQRPSFYSERTRGHRVSELEQLEIDEPLDLDWAGFLIARGHVDPAQVGLTPEGVGSNRSGG